MRVLVLHQNFPGQYRHLVAALQARGDSVQAIGSPRAPGLDGVEMLRYRLPDSVATVHAWAADFQVKVIRAEAVLDLLQASGDRIARPDLIVGHPGWGELLAVKDHWPDVPVLHQVEFVYPLQGEGGDSDFDPEFPPGPRDASRLRLRRATQLLAFHDLDWGLAPTAWQASTAPARFRDRVSVIHEGIDTRRIAPRPGSRITLGRAGLSFRPGDELVSFVARNLEPYRGIHPFLRSLPLLQQLRPRAQVIVVGGDGVSYGRPPEGGGSWRERLLTELEGRIDLTRVHFVGTVPHGVLHDLFRVCAAHVYLTYPFVLSWSLLEAMACGAVVVGSRTPPLEEVIEPGRNGLLVDFFSPEQLARQVAAVLADPAAHRPLGEAARRTVVDRFDLLDHCLPRQLRLLDWLAAGGADSGSQPPLEG